MRRSSKAFGTSVVFCLCPAKTVRVYDKTIVEALLAGFRELSKIVHDFFEYPEVLEVCGLLAGGDLFDFDRKNGCNPIRKRIPEDLSVRSIDKLKAIAVDLRRNLGELICPRIPDAPVDGARQLSFRARWALPSLSSRRRQRRWFSTLEPSVSAANSFSPRSMPAAFFRAVSPRGISLVRLMN